MRTGSPPLLGLLGLVIAYVIAAAQHEDKALVLQALRAPASFLTPTLTALSSLPLSGVAHAGASAWDVFAPSLVPFVENALSFRPPLGASLSPNLPKETSFSSELSQRQ